MWHGYSGVGSRTGTVEIKLHRGGDVGKELVVIKVGLGLVLSASPEFGIGILAYILVTLLAGGLLCCTGPTQYVQQEL